ncbi:squalene/phytoene synthase family protein [Streptomyces sp. Ag109_G2-15]|uniref:squalene/phytoene synthase family protein n=1 Tax=Streptomyces sp. Ag109_G2-15 TaxID=1938850 RepID=UPI00211B7E5D|nr:squalene/phytoene synthase family protein [Streptomyces sp. Ag109_G2-15]
MQRTDFLADLPEDLRQGHIGIPRDELLRHGLDVEDLRERPEACLPAMERVVNAQAALAEQVFSQHEGCRHSWSRSIARSCVL